MVEPLPLPDNLFYHYQPVLDDTRQPVWFEALLRWRDSSGIIRAPEELLPLLLNGSYRLLNAFTAHTIHNAASMLEAHGHTMRISINLSPQQLCGTEAWQLLRALPARTRECLIIEVTEDALPGKEEYQLVLGETAALGIDIILDDLVPATAGERLLPALPVSGVKLDRSLLSALCNAGETSPVASFVRQMLEEGLTVTAEGISDPAQLSLLGRLGITRFQGFGLGTPRPVPEMLPAGDGLLPRRTVGRLRRAVLSAAGV